VPLAGIVGTVAPSAARDTPSAQNCVSGAGRPAQSAPSMTGPPLTTVELFLIAMAVIFALPYAIWRLGRTDYWAPLVVVQIVTGILLGPGLFGAAFPEIYRAVFTPAVVQSLNGLAWWAVMLFVFIAGLELDLRQAWKHRGETAITAGLAMVVPMALGSGVALVVLAFGGTGWIGPRAANWQFVLGIGMAAAVTALPILILLMDKMQILRQPLGQRILRYASLDDIAIWAVLAAILLDWVRIGRQALFLVAFALLAWALRRWMPRLVERDRWAVALVWLALVALGADWCGLHFMVGAFLAGAVLDGEWFDQERTDQLRHHVLLVLMPVFFLSTGLRTEWGVGGVAVFGVAAALLVAAVAGKLAGTHLAGRLLGWAPGEAALVGWLLQTKALIMIIFSNVLLDRGVITADTFTALLLMAVASTMLTVPMVAPRLARLAAVVSKSG
jgi:Kef-type K+ transport system membrane component KefB